MRSGPASGSPTCTIGPDVADDEPALGPGHLDRRLDDDLFELRRVERRPERVPEVVGGVTEAQALAVEVREPLLELLCHVVERTAERGELVAPVDVHPLVEPARLRSQFAADDRSPRLPTIDRPAM